MLSVQRVAARRSLLSATAQAKAAALGSDSPASERSPLIAVIDDNPDIVDAATDALLERGYRVTGYRDAGHALEAMEHDELPSLIVFDLMMPHMDGWTFRVKQRASARLREIPVIVMTASGSPQAEAIHADAYLRKPVSMERFCAAVEQTHASAERRRLLARSAEIERLRALGLLVTSVAHEINNPLTYVSGNLDLALRDCPRVLGATDPSVVIASITKALLNARVGANHVAAIVSSLLVFARAEDSNAQTADPGRALDAAWQLGKTFASARASLQREWSELPRVVGQEARLAQVFLNLIINAAQAIEPGAREHNRITVSARAKDQRVIIEVSDTGRGISDENLGLVFDAFFTTKPVGEGTGVGLSFCKEVVEQGGGTISVRSTVGAGTTVTVVLKLAASGPVLQ